MKGDNRQKMSAGKENTRRLVANFLRVTPEEIVLTRNTSEANNISCSNPLGALRTYLIALNFDL